MPKISLKCEIATPIFMGSSDSSRLASSIRSFSVRGQLRYWLRAALGIQYKNNVQELLENEGMLLGDTTVGSSILVSIEEGKQKLAAGERVMLPHKDGFSQQCFVQDQTFEIRLETRPGLSSFPNPVLSALVLWTHLGGLGKRSRRGFGSLGIQEVINADQIEQKAVELLNTHPQDGEQLAEHLKQVLIWSTSRMGVSTSYAPFKSNYPNLSPGCSSVLVCKKGLNMDYESAMKEFWDETLHHNDLMDSLAFGYAMGRDRRASPFHLHIARIGKEHHFVLTTFWSTPDPNQKQPQDGWQCVEDLLDKCKNEWQGEVVWGRR